MINQLINEVSTAVLLFWTAFIGFLMTVTYGLVYPGSAILSHNVVNIPARDWLLFLGESLKQLQHQHDDDDHEMMMKMMKMMMMMMMKMMMMMMMMS